MNATAKQTFRFSDHMTRMGLLSEPAGYVDGNNLYEGYKGSPANHTDPMGLRIGPDNNDGIFDGDPYKSGDLGGIVPDGDGGLIPAINEGHKDVLIPGVREVVEAHERSHLDDFMRDYPHAGRDGAQPDGKPRKSTSKPARPQHLSPRDWEKWLRESEKKAWKDTLRRIREILETEGETTMDILDENGNWVTLRVRATKRWHWAKKLLKTAERRSETGEAY